MGSGPRVGERCRTWDDEGFTSCEGVTEPLRVLHTLETVQRRERIAGEWKRSAETSSWYWATSFSRKQLPAREFWRAGHARWDIENDCFNTTSTHWGLDHVFKHEPTAIVNFVLTLFPAFVLLQCFWQRNLKPPLRDCFTLIGLAAELYAALAAAQRGGGRCIPRRWCAVVRPHAGHRRAARASHASGGVAVAHPCRPDLSATAVLGIPSSLHDSGHLPPLENGIMSLAKHA